MIINESAENYLETILVLSKKLPVVRSINVANALGVTKSSVCTAMKNLKTKGHITMSEAGYICLTESGLEIAELLFERREVIKGVLEKLGVPSEIAAEDACKIEHYLSKESFEAIKRIV